MVYWFTGAMVHWFTGAMVHWFTGALVHWFTGALVLLVHWFTWCTKVCFSLFRCSAAIARLTSCTKGKLCNVYIMPQKLVTWSAYSYTYVDRN